MSEKWGMKAYLKGVALLTIAALVVKILSMVYRVPFQNLVGDHGFYIYQQVYPFIAIFVTWTASGLAVAISKILADIEDTSDEGERSTVLLIIFIFLVVLSIVCFSILYFGARFFAYWMGDIKLAGLLRIGSFVAFSMPLLAIYKGVFQSVGIMQPVAYAQIVEQTVRVAVILGGTYIIMSTTESLYGAGKIALLGTVVGEFAGILLLAVYIKKQSTDIKLGRVGKRKLATWGILKKLIVLSISVSMSSLVLLVFQLIDSFTIYSTLKESGMNPLRAMETKGIYDRGQPLVQVGLVIASSLSLAIVPLVAHASKRNQGHNAERYIQLTYRTALLFGLAAAVGLILVMPNINMTLFETTDLSNVLSVFVLQIIWLSLILTLTAMLQGLDYLKIPALLLVLGVFVKLFFNKLFILQFGIAGAAWTGNLALFITVIGLIWYFKKEEKIQLALPRFYFGASLALLAMILVVVLFTILAEPMIFPSIAGRARALVLCISKAAIGAFVFLTMLAKLKILSIRDWYLLPFGRRMASYQLALQRKNKQN
ncbi:polysaccharide biosynthesis protein [Rummeliibacillus sp. POC4]|uniref:putative polysaccharide biosynthesis protein n=1 Tax=Rummeliibacillus sp. POC4 TaxID=2305899 RepID=UPI000E662C67|nr:polysaccharide biosynthesis protein [Rummeliibacillus sp. POC4]RIJ64322.1 polysaccharide biosynthesis protein [Rummeliibacillus sp. POC4]